MFPWRRGNFNQRRRATARSWERPTRSRQVSHHWALCMCTLFRKRTDHFCLCRIHRVSPLLVSRLPILSSQCWTSLFFLLQPLPWQVFLQLTVTPRQPGPSVLHTHTLLTWAHGRQSNWGSVHCQTPAILTICGQRHSVCNCDVVC